MKFLVDADVLSEATRTRPEPRVLVWLDSRESDILVNPIVLGELEYGIRRLPEGKRKRGLLQWFEAGASRLNVLPMDADTASHWAVLLVELHRRGRAMPVKDSLIAATARQHGLTVATRNTRDFQHAGVPLLNPFAAD